MLNKVFGLDFVFISVDQSDISKDFNLEDIFTFCMAISRGLGDNGQFSSLWFPNPRSPLKVHRVHQKKTECLPLWPCHPKD
jgi:hypothetical protein